MCVFITVQHSTAIGFSSKYLFMEYLSVCCVLVCTQPLIVEINHMHTSIYFSYMANSQHLVSCVMQVFGEGLKLMLQKRRIMQLSQEHKRKGEEAAPFLKTMAVSMLVLCSVFMRLNLHLCGS